MPIFLTKTQKEELDIAEVCALCEFASPLVGGTEVLCAKHGVVPAEYRCRKFRYDLLKRRPARRIIPEQPSGTPLPTLDDDEND